MTDRGGYAASVIEYLNTTLTQITNLLGVLGGLPGYVLVFLTCIGFGFVLKCFTRFPNDGIPLAVVLWGMIWNALIADLRGEGVPLRVWIVKNFMFGACLGLFAWFIHFNRRRIPILKRLFNSSFDTKFLRKPTPTTERTSHEP